MKRKRVFHGQVGCEKDGCGNNAYWAVGDSFLCGVHCKNNKERAPLPKDPNAKEAAEAFIAARAARAEEVEKRNAEVGLPGRVACAKMMMMRSVLHRDGYSTVFPNFRHGNRKDGIGASELSPMSLGPVHHGEPGLPPAKNVENYHQGRKAFLRELTPDGDPSPEYYASKKAFYEDPIPHRHKFKEMARSEVNKNIPAYSVHLTPSGEERWYDYVESRYFYCHQYEILAEKTSKLGELRDMLEGGRNLLIVGYDGQEVISDQRAYEEEGIAKALQVLYESPDKPFGHELVLFSLLVLGHKPRSYPWNVYKKKHSELYD